MVTLSIVGSAYWRPEPRARVTLELGDPTPVALSPRAADSTIASVLELVAPTVAFITIPEEARSGSGVVVHEAGFVVTNAHVVEGGGELQVTFDDGSRYDGEVYGIDPSTDLAVIKVAADAPLVAAPLGDSDALQVGEFVVALGAPFGLEATATSGIVSGLHRSGLGIARFEDFIVTDAPINRGNSGGPLVNLRGEVVGINTAIIAGEDNPRGIGTFAGVGFAIPVNVMRVVAQRLIGDGGLTDSAGAMMGAGGVRGDLELDDDPARPRSTPVGDGRPRQSAATDPPLEAVGYEAPVTSLDASVGYVEIFDEAGNNVGRGSGFVVTTGENTLLITNEHVVDGARAVRVSFRDSSTSGYFGLAGSVLVANEGFDLALISLPDDPRLAPLRLGDAEQVVVGYPVVAAGMRTEDGRLSIHQGGGQVTEVSVDRMGLPARALIIATDIGIRLGDSGGPLFDDTGAVVGVMMARDLEEAVETNPRSYAIMLRAEEEFAVLLEGADNPGFETGFLPYYPKDGRSFILILNLEEGGLAERFGHQEGDRILAIDGEPVPAEELAQLAAIAAFRRMEPDTEVTLTIERMDEAGTWQPREVVWRIPSRSQQP
jgi:S1-C subfamily serine protease